MQWSLFLGKFVNEFRKTLKIPELDGQDLDGIPILNLYSSLIFPTPKDWPPHCIVTGYWILPPSEAYEPPSALSDFLQHCDETSGVFILFILFILFFNFLKFNKYKIKSKRKSNDILFSFTI